MEYGKTIGHHKNAFGGIVNIPERKSPTETLDLQQKIADTMAGKRSKDDKYPYFSPDYELPFTHIGTERQLFVDNFILDHLDDVVRVFPKPNRPDKPILEVGDLPWENPKHSNPIPVAAVHDEDEKKYKLWYTQSLTGDPFNTGQVLCYAESNDCMNWIKPLSEECLPYNGHTATNIVQTDAASVTVVLNRDKSNPKHKYLMIYCPYKEASEKGKNFVSTVAASPNGLKWNRISEDSPFPHHHEPRIIWDESIQRWIAYGQYSHHWHHGPRIRQIGRQESPDFINWSPKEVVLSPDWDSSIPPSLEFASMSIRKIGGLYLGIVSEYPCEPLWFVRNDKNMRDQMHPRLGLYNSRDGKRWYRVGNGPWADNRGPGSIDYGYLEYSTAGYLSREGKIYIPYIACPHKQWGTGRADNPVLAPENARIESQSHLDFMKANCIDPDSDTLRRSVGVLILREDGWAMLKPTYEYGKAYTKQFVFEGNSLKVNADCKYGCVKVEILDPHFKPYEGFSADDCNPVHDKDGGKIWHTVTWKGKSDVSALWNKPVRIAFHLHEAYLYAFQFVGDA